MRPGEIRSFTVPVATPEPAGRSDLRLILSGEIFNESLGIVIACEVRPEPRGDSPLLVQTDHGAIQPERISWVRADWLSPQPVGTISDGDLAQVRQKVRTILDM